MAMKKRVTRKQLLKEPDEFITTTGKLIRFAQTHQRRLLTAIGAIVLVLLVVVGVRLYKDASEKKAFSIFDQTMDKYTTALEKDGIQKAYALVQPDFEGILKKYSGNNGGKIARLAFANICYQAGAFDLAAELYTRSIKDFQGDAFYGKLISSSIGYVQEGQDNLDAAAKTFESMASEPEAFLGDEALFHLGGIYAAKGNQEKSKAAYQRIVSEFPNSIYVDMAIEKLAG